MIRIKKKKDPETRIAFPTTASKVEFQRRKKKKRRKAKEMFLKRKNKF
jgi:hypothetical protein